MMIRTTHQRPMLLLVALLAAACAAPAFAQNDANGPARRQQAAAQLEQRFKDADANADGLLSKEEAKAKMPRVYAHFDMIDTEHTGSVSLEQLRSFSAQMLKQRRGAP